MASSSRNNSQNKRKPPSQTTLKLDLVTTPPAKRLKPLGAFSKPPVFNLSGSQSKLSQSSQGDVKGKGKATVQPKPKFEVVEEVGHESDGLWVDMYGPTTEAELAVHVRKVNDVRQWLLEAFEGGPSGKLRKYRKLLVLTGPAGTGKTTTLRVLSRELGFEILEWKNTADERFYGRDDFDSDERGNRIEYEGLSEKFHAFLSRAITTTNSTSVLSSSSSTSHSQSQAHPSRRIVLLEDLPNILHPPTRASFHASLHTAIRATSSLSTAPIVIVVSDAGVRGESDEGNISSWKGKGREVVDIRTALPPDLLHSPYVTQISFNPIAPTLMKRALQTLLSSHLRLKGLKPPSKELLDLIVETSNGDIRSAVMALQFACTSASASASSSDVPSKSTGKGRSKKEAKGGKGREESARWVEVMSRREQSLVLFHLLGKVLYNKRKGDAPSASASARDVARERALDMRLKDPPPLPEWLAGHERRSSRVDVEALYADTPIDASLLSLYIHQNYTQYCSPAGLDECEGVVEWLSWVDSSGGESWQQTNPHQFHLLTLGTLHALPSPVPRLGQKPYKPAFFDNLKATREAQDGVGDVLGWLRRQEGAGTGWTRREVALEMGGILKAFDVSGSGQSRSNSFNGRPPASHRTFSRLEFTKGSTSITDVVDDTTTGRGEEEGEGGEEGEEDETRDPEKAAGGWLESDDIEDW